MSTMPLQSTQQQARLTNLVSQGIIDGKQLGFIALKNAEGDPSLQTAIESLLPLRSSNPSVFATAISSLIASKGGPVGPDGSESKESSAEPAIQSQPEENKLPSSKDSRVDEVIAICIDVSGSMRTDFESDRTRLQAVKQMFYGYRDQTTTFERGRHLLGLISYDNKITVHTNPISDYGVFEEVIDAMECRGSTAIYGAIAAGCNMLKPFNQSHPGADLRVICLSDGQNNNNQVTSHSALQSLYDIGGVCDCIIVGNNPDKDLLRLVAATQGTCFQINSLAQAYECLESEAMISLSARRNFSPKPAFERKEVPANFSHRPVPKVHSGALVVTQAPTSSPDTKFIPLENMLSSGGKGQQQRRLKSELQRLKQDCKDGGSLADTYRIFVGVTSTGVIKDMKVLLLGQPGTPYHKGVFQLNLKFAPDYPFRAPSLRFQTSIYHYAVSTQGGICLPLLQDKWSPSVLVSNVLTKVSLLIHSCKTEDPKCELSQRSWLSELLRVNPEVYAANALAATQQHAAASVDLLTQQIVS